MFEFNLLVKDKKSKARVGEFQTPHGKLLTPELAFVATEGEIKAIPREILPKLPVNLIIVNTFHLWVKKILNKKQTVDDRKLKLEKEDGKLKIERNQSSNLQHQYPASSFQPPASIFSIHDYANFQKPIMSDSGGFQVFSLGFGKAHGVGKIASIFPDENKKEKGLLLLRDHDNLLNINEQGVMFNYDKKWFLFTPEMSIDIQEQIGADIIFAFDECTSPLNSHDYTKKAMERTHSWLKRCIKKYKKSQNLNPKSQINSKFKIQNYKRLKLRNSNLFGASNLEFRIYPQALFGVVQGGYFEDLRKQSAKFVGKQDVLGFGIGGTLGRDKEDMHRVIEWTISYLPDEKPRHLFGIGQVRDIFEAVERGVDLFDCVIPTREARHKVLYTNHGRINLNKMKNVKEVIDKNCDCATCKEKMTFYKLYELYKRKDSKAFFYATVHNIQFYADLMRNIREAIEFKKFSKLKEKMLSCY